MRAETNQRLKEKFDYEVLMSKVDKAGINSVGGECENELEDLLVEIRDYEKNHKLW